MIDWLVSLLVRACNQLQPLQPQVEEVECPPPNWSVILKGSPEGAEFGRILRAGKTNE